MPFIIGLYCGKIGQYYGNFLGVRQPKIKEGVWGQTPIATAPIFRARAKRRRPEERRPAAPTINTKTKTAPHLQTRTGRLTTMTSILKHLGTSSAWHAG